MYKDLIESFFKRLPLLGEGRKRIVFLGRSGKYIFKVPKDGYGELGNFQESRDYEKNYFLGRKHLARCRLVRNILVMEKLEPVTDLKGLPEWTSYVDCSQVGYNRKGILLAYDWENVKSPIQSI